MWPSSIGAVSRCVARSSFAPLQAVGELVYSRRLASIVPLGRPRNRVAGSLPMRPKYGEPEIGRLPQIRNSRTSVLCRTRRCLGLADQDCFPGVEAEDVPVVAVEIAKASSVEGAWSFGSFAGGAPGTDLRAAEDLVADDEGLRGRVRPAPISGKPNSEKKRVDSARFLTGRLTAIFVDIGASLVV